MYTMSCDWKKRKFKKYPTAQAQKHVNCTAETNAHRWLTGTLCIGV